MGRMAASPFAFLRGSACVMASDLSTSPISGIPVVMDGDAHINNFGMYGTPQQQVVFDLNDFDEATIGPWEWDLKRLVASINVAGRQNGLNRRERAVAVRRGVEGYRFNINRLESMGVLEVWYLHAYPGRTNPIAKIDQNPKRSSPRLWPKPCRPITAPSYPRSLIETATGNGPSETIRRFLPPFPRTSKRKSSMR